MSERSGLSERERQEKERADDIRRRQERVASPPVEVEERKRNVGVAEEEEAEVSESKPKAKNSTKKTSK